MDCRQCGTNNPPDSNFCARCGDALVASCESCGAASPSSSRFCGKCGAPSAFRKARLCFGSAIEIARDQDAKSEELSATIQMARLIAQQGRRQTAHAMLKKIYSWFTEGFDTAGLKEAKALLDELKG